MLTYVIFLLQKTSQALSVMLNIPVPLTDQTTVYFKDIILFLFTIYIFMKFATVLLSSSVSVSAPSRESKFKRFR